MADRDTPSSYHLRKNLEYVATTPKFLQNILKAQAEQAHAKERHAQDQVCGRDEGPLLVDSEGNAWPDELLESDIQLDLAFSDIPSEPDYLPKPPAEDEACMGSARKKSRLAPRSKEGGAERVDARKLDKVAFNQRMLSFNAEPEDDDLQG